MNESTAAQQGILRARGSDSAKQRLSHLGIGSIPQGLMHPVLIDFGSFQLHTYGLMMALAFMIGMQLATREARRVDTTADRNFGLFTLDVCFWILVAGLLGARILYIITMWKTEYAHDPLKVFRVWEGGLVFYGGLLGATAWAYAYSKYKGQNFFRVADILIPQVAMGQFFGRLGCFGAGCCWGRPVDPEFILGVQFPKGSLAFSSMARAGEVAVEASHTHSLHASQLYESFGTLLIFFILHAIRPGKRFNGQILLSYMMLYSGLRFMLEFWRGDDAERLVFNLFGEIMLSTSQLISIGWAGLALAMLVFILRSKGSSEQGASSNA